MSASFQTPVTSALLANSPPRQSGAKRSYNHGMSAWRLLIVLIAYVVFDLADPLMPGAFSFEVEGSPIEEAVHANRPRQEQTAMAVQPTIPARAIDRWRRDDPASWRLVLDWLVSRGTRIIDSG